MAAPPLPVCVNIRTLKARLTGAQRYVQEIVRRLPAEHLRLISPSFHRTGGLGHIWEQLVLPLCLARGQLLWSPSMSGPLAIGRQVVTLFDVAPLDHPEWFRPNYARFQGFLIPRLARRAKHVITISEFTKQRIVELCKVPESKVSVTLLAADERFSPAARDPGINARLALPFPRYLLALGSIEPRKNLPALLAAWKRIAATLPPDIGLVIAGGAGNSTIFGEVALDANQTRVHYTGHVPDEALPALLAGALAFCYPSIYEGFGLPPLEAMACGVPVLTGNRTSLPEVVGDAGLSVDPDDVGQIAEGLLRLIQDQALREDLGARGLARNRLFSWDTAAAQTWQILCDAAG